VRLTSHGMVDRFAAPEVEDLAFADEDHLPAMREQLEALASALPAKSRVTLALLCAGATHAEIAKYKRCTQATTGRHVRYLIGLLRHLVAIGYADIPHRHQNPIIAAYLQHLTCSRAAQALGVTRRTVRWAVEQERARLACSSSAEDAALLRVLEGLRGLRVCGR